MRSQKDWTERQNQLARFSRLDFSSGSDVLFPVPRAPDMSGGPRASSDLFTVRRSSLPRGALSRYISHRFLDLAPTDTGGVGTLDGRGWGPCVTLTSRPKVGPIVWMSGGDTCRGNEGGRDTSLAPTLFAPFAV